MKRIMEELEFIGSKEENFESLKTLLINKKIEIDEEIDFQEFLNKFIIEEFRKLKINKDDILILIENSNYSTILKEIL